MSLFLVAAEFPQYANENGVPVGPGESGARLVEWPSPRYLERHPGWWPETPVASQEERERALSWHPVTPTKGA